MASVPIGVRDFLGVHTAGEEEDEGGDGDEEEAGGDVGVGRDVGVGGVHVGEEGVENVSVRDGEEGGVETDLCEEDGDDDDELGEEDWAGR